MVRTRRRGGTAAGPGVRVRVSSFCRQTVRVLGRIGIWRHVVVALAIITCAVLALVGVIGAGNRERFDAKQVVVTPVGAASDGLRIREVVDQDFGSKNRHGYERRVPNDFGAPTEITASSPDAPDDLDVVDLGPKTRIRVGDADTTVSGQHRYVLAYTLPEAMVTTGRLALDIIGTDEKVETGRFEVVLSGMELVDPQCNVGSEGESGGCTLERDGDVYRAVISPLEPGEGITIGGTIASVGEPVVVPEPPLPDRREDRGALLAGLIVVLATLASAAIFLRARRRGRNEVFAGGAAEAAYGTLPAPGPDGKVPAAATVLVPDDQMDELATIEFVPPKGIEPWQGAVLLRERINDDTVAAWFSGLAAKEAITLSEDDDNLVIGSGPRRAQLDRYAAAHVDHVLDGRDSFELGTYDKEFAETWRAIRHEQDAAIKATGWWKRLPPNSTAGGGRSAWLIVTAVAVVLFGLGSLVTAFVGLISNFWVALAFGIAVPAVIAAAVYRTLLPVRSATGSALTLRTESFRRFLDASEGRHVEWAWSQGLLREYSAWAVALGAADAWNRALADANVPPEARLSTTPLLVYSMGSSIAGSHTPPSSSGGGGGGGGFSGGSVGGGGGGGSSGSW
jgi:uncharacterized membrane protein YgcG